MKKLLIMLVVLVATLILCGCGQEATEKKENIKSGGNVIAKWTGGKATIELPPKQKLVSVTWKGKDDSMWILYRPFREDEKPETYSYQEDSMWGLMEATIVIKERE